MNVTGYNYSENARQVLIAAQAHATRLRSEQIAPEHILLGITSVPDCVAATALVNVGASLDAIAKGVATRMPQGQASPAGHDLPYAAPAKQVLELAMTEAQGLRHSYVGSEHLLLGVLREGKSGAASWLREQQVTSERVRPEVMNLLGSNRQSIVRGGVPAMAIADVPAAPDGARVRLALTLSVVALVVAHIALAVALAQRG